MQIPFMVACDGRVWDEPRGQYATGWSVLDRLYHAEDGRWLYLAAPSFSDLARVAGLEGATSEAELEARFATDTAANWVERLLAAGVSASVNFDFYSEVMEDPVVQRRGLSLLRQHDELGEVRSIGPVRRLSGTPIQPAFAAPPAGWHTRALVAEAGLGDRVDDLLAGGIVAERQPEGVSPVGQLVALPTRA
jgi:crotonobetainyl-CoA:carnitine CoA-transferase CaiB-like acyl-CoA transferase